MTSLFIPDRRKTLSALAHGDAVPLAQPVPAAALPDLPRLAEGLMTAAPCWFLDSARQHPTAGRYSYIGWEPAEVLQNVTLAQLRERLTRHPTLRVPSLPPFTGGAMGYLSYECRHAFERLPQRAARDVPLPENAFALYDTVVAVDHLTEQLYVITRTMPVGSPARQYDAAVRRIETVLERLRACAAASETVTANRAQPGPLRATVDQDRFTWMVRRALDYIKEGDIYQANLSVRFTADTQASPWELYRRLRQINPSPYAAFADLGDAAIVSCSPELLLRVRGDQVVTRPIAGTRPRGVTPEDDLAQAVELILSDKERAEHLMLVDLERNDLGRVCRYGSVVVDELMALEEYSHVMHIVSNVRGELRAGRGWAEALAAMFPGGTITGCPKIRAMDIIDELEPTARGLYTGSLGWISYTGDAEFNIAIRTMIVHGGRVHIQAGAGIVADSQPAREYAELRAKAQALFEALQSQAAAEVAHAV